jgi:glutamate synthase domain-containing protein 3
MHGGEIFIRGAVEDWACGTEVSVSAATDPEKAGLRPVLADYCSTFGLSLDAVLSASFTRIAPTGSRPYARLYTDL